MLVKLLVENLALIDYLDLDFKQGLIVLSGETGAGKSLILDALSLILGYRASSELVRRGAEKTVVQAIFEGSALPDDFRHLCEDGQLIITRELAQSGRSIARVNGQLVTISTLRTLGSLLVDLHGQHEHQSLLHVEKHRAVLDQFAGPEAQALLKGIGQLVDRYQTIERELANLVGDGRERERRLDMLRFQLEEITSARLKPGEEETLLTERKVLANAEKLFAAAGKAYQVVYQGQNRQPAVSNQLGQIVNDLAAACRLDERLRPWHDLLQNALYYVEEAAHSLRDYLDGLSHEPDQLEKLERRLDQISKLKRKYGESVDGIIGFADSLESEIAKIENSAVLVDELRAEQAKLQHKYQQMADALSKLRQATAERIEQELSVHLADLGLKSAVFRVRLLRSERCEPERFGHDRIEFLFSANLGEEPKPLIKVISGGEMSRVMLALKTLLATHDEIDTLIFDEIDVGLGGAVALSVGEKLRTLAASHQVICISHLASIACLADQHLLIRKEVVDAKTYTRVEALSGEARVHEIARMLDGQASPIAYQHARELLAIQS